MMKVLKYLIILIFIFSCIYSLFLLSKSRSFQIFGKIVNRVNTNQKVVALTFDDAPTKKTLEVLDILKEKQIKATFYETGKGIEENSVVAAAIVEAGMEVGNHSYSHQRFLLKPLSFINTEIQKTNKLIRDSGYAGNITFRPPNGKKLFLLPWYLSTHDIKTITWDVEPDTYVHNLKEGDEKVKSIIDYTLKNTKPGSIILLHPFCESCESDRQAIPQIIDELQSKGYRFVTVSELLQSS